MFTDLSGTEAPAVLYFYFWYRSTGVISACFVFVNKMITKKFVVVTGCSSVQDTAHSSTWNMCYEDHLWQGPVHKVTFHLLKEPLKVERAPNTRIWRERGKRLNFVKGIVAKSCYKGIILCEKYKHLSGQFSLHVLKRILTLFIKVKIKMAEGCGFKIMTHHS